MSTAACKKCGMTVQLNRGRCCLCNSVLVTKAELARIEAEAEAQVKAAEENTKRFIDNPKRKEASEKVAERLNKPKEKKVSKPKDDLEARLAKLESMLSDTGPKTDRTELISMLRVHLTEIEQTAMSALELIRLELGDD